MQQQNNPIKLSLMSLYGSFNNTIQKLNYWSDNKVIDFVNWYITEVCKLNFRYTLENQTIIDNFKEMNLNKLEQKLDTALENETNESLTVWLQNKRELKSWKDNCEDDYIQTPISVLKYISELETELVRQSEMFVNQQRDTLNYSDAAIMIEELANLRDSESEDGISSSLFRQKVREIIKNEVDGTTK